jgi:hypothetical protein
MFLKKLKAAYYAIKYHNKNKHLFLYAITCAIKNIEEPSIYDIDKIAEQMNNLVNDKDFNSHPYIEKLNLKNIEYTRDDIRRYQSILNSFRNVEPKPSMDDCIIFLYHMVTTNRFKLIWEMFTAKD